MACVECQRKGLECKTTFPRKKRSHAGNKSLGLHYRCLHALLKSIFPDVDVDNIDFLIKIGHDLNVEMPSKTTSDSDIRVGDLITSQTGIECENKSLSLEEMIENDHFILDKNGISHYIGPMGGASLLIKTAKFLMESNQLSKSFPKEFQKVYEDDAIVSSNPYQFNNLQVLDINRADGYPFVHGLNKSFCDIYKEVFFDKLFPFYPCMKKARFEHIYEDFWDVNGNCKGPDSDCALDNICCIYAVIVLGYYYHKELLFSGETNPIITKLLRNIELSISSLSLFPTLTGIITFILLAVYYSKNKKRECSYLIIELACRQAMAIGLARRSMNECVADEDVKDEMKRIWWVLYQEEVKICKLLGRVSSISLIEVNIGYPEFEHWEFFQCMFLSSLKLVQIVHRFPKFAYSSQESYLKRSCPIVLRIRLSMQQWYNDFEKQFAVEDARLTFFEYRLAMEYHYYNIDLLFGFVIQLTNEPPKNTEHDNIYHRLAGSCLYSATKISELLTGADEIILFNPFWSPHLNYAFLATLCLSRAYIWITKFKVDMLMDERGNKIPKQKIQLAMISLRKYNKRHLYQWTGSSSKLSKYIEVLLGNFKFIMKENNKSRSPTVFHESFSQKPPTEKQMATNGGAQNLVLDVNLNHGSYNNNTDDTSKTDVTVNNDELAVTTEPNISLSSWDPANDSYIPNSVPSNESEEAAMSDDLASSALTMELLERIETNMFFGNDIMGL